MSRNGRVFIDPGLVSAVVHREVLHVSYSQVKTYLLCPERYRQQYVCARQPSHRSAEVVLGSVLHDVLATHHEHIRRNGEPPPEASLHDHLDTRLGEALRDPVAILWGTDEAPEKIQGLAHALVTLYCEHVVIGRVLAVELRFALPPAEWPAGNGREELLTGVIDLIERDADGTTWLTELKTAARKFDDNRLSFDPQLGLYAAARKLLGVPDARLRYRVLLKTKTPSIVTYEVHRADADVKEAFELVASVLRAIELKVFYRQRGWQCDICPYRATCGE